MNKHKSILITGLLAIVFVLAVGYAAFATQLNINGTANISSNWDIHIQSITPGQPVGSATNKIAPTIGTDRLSAIFNTDLISPGDSLTYTVVIKNDGSLDAKLSNLVFRSDENPAIVYGYNGINQNDVIIAESTRSFTVTVTYNSNITTQPQLLESNLEMIMSFIQNN